MITLASHLLDEIKKHGEREYPHECCGLLIGKLSNETGAKMLIEVWPVSNAREEAARHHRSLIMPQELLRGERYARARNLEVIGNYHSHPDHPAIPSGYDLEHAWPVWSYIIVSVQQGEAAEVRSWVMQNDRSRFDGEEMEISTNE